MGARRIIHEDVRQSPNILYTDVTCLEHSQHLVSLSCLKTADRCLEGMRDWKYFGSLATCSNVCRDVGKAIYSEWVKDYGIASAKQHCKSLWPKAIAGRWSGCNKSEERFLLCGRQRLAPILTTVLGKTAASAKKSVKSTVDEHSVEEAQAYSERMSRWKKRTAECIQDSLWWQVVEVMNKTRGPLSHFSNFLHKPQGEWGHIAQLVGGKANDIKEEFNSVWSSLRKSGCLAHTGNENDYDSDQVQSQFVRNLASLGFGFAFCSSCWHASP